MLELTFCQAGRRLTNQPACSYYSYYFILFAVYLLLHRTTGAWVVLFALFFAVLLSRAQAVLGTIGAEATDDEAMAAITTLWQAWVAELPALLIRVFVVTFAATYTVIMLWYTIKNRIALLRQ